MLKEKFNSDWKFWANKDSFALVWNIPEHAVTVTLPHDAMILEKAKAESLNGGNTGYRDGEVYTYAKLLEVPVSSKNKTISLQFEGVYMNAFVYINGQLAGKNPFGYSTFNVELDRFLKYGETNEIRVEVRAGAMTNSRWYSGAGIYRDVYIIESELTHIEVDGVRVKTENLDGDDAVLTVQTDIKNRNNQTSNVLLETTILDRENNIVAMEKTNTTLFTNDERTVKQRIYVENPKLWSENSPYLYTCVSKLFKVENGEIDLIDQSVENFGIRTLTLDAKRGLRVNGESVKLRGACIHHDSGLLGASTYFDAQYRQIKKLKEAGFNAIRMAHQPMSKPMLKACDELGVYVMDELSDIWTRCKSNYDYGLYFNEWWNFDLTAMVRKDYNHPSVIMYSLGNEIPEVATDLGVEISYKLDKRIKELDDTRYTLLSINGVFAVGDKVDIIVKDVVADLKSQGKIEGNVNNFMQLMDKHMDKIVIHNAITESLEKACSTTDIAGYNYMTARYEIDGVKYPNRVIVGSETYPPEIARNWDIVKASNHVIGDFTWTGWDYIGEAGVGVPAYQWGEGGFGAKFPAQLAYCGDFDITGVRRPLSYFREIVFGLRKAPYIAVQNPEKYGEHLIKTPWVLSDAVASWTYETVGKPVVVEVYSCGDEVELLLNSKVIDRKAAGQKVGYITTFETTYEKGELVAVTYEGGKELGRVSLCTTKETKKLVLLKEEYSRKFNEQELIYLNVEVQDEEGNLAMEVVKTLELEVSDNVEVLGFGSGNPKTNYNYNEGVTDTFLGKATIVLKRIEKGLVTVKVFEQKETGNLSKEISF